MKTATSLASKDWQATKRRESKLVLDVPPGENLLSRPPRPGCGAGSSKVIIIVPPQKPNRICRTGAKARVVFVAAPRKLPAIMEQQIKSEIASKLLPTPMLFVLVMFASVALVDFVGKLFGH